MSIRNRVVQLHLLLAGFLLQLAIIYFASGVLYTLDIKGHIEKE